MVTNLTTEAKKEIDSFKRKFDKLEKLTPTEESLKSIANSLIILSEKIGKKLL